MSFKGLASVLKNTTDEKLTISEMTDRLNNGNVTYNLPKWSATGYIQGDDPGLTGVHFPIPDIDKIFQFRDYCYYGTPIQVAYAFTNVLKRVGISAFEGCTKLERMAFHGNPYDDTGDDIRVLEEVADRAFFGAGSSSSVSDLNLLSNEIGSPALERIGVSAFENSGHAGVYYYGMWVGTTSGYGAPLRIEARAFANSFLSDLHLHSSVEYIAPDAFLGCTALKDIYIYFSQSSSAATNYPWGADTSITTFHWRGE